MAKPKCCNGQMQITCALKDTCMDGTRTVDTYRAQIEAFNQKKRSVTLTSHARLLFYALLEHANEINWPDSFDVQAVILQANSGLGRSSLYRARSELKDAGLISLAENGGRSSATYRITI
jgi:hypothetical protein